MYKFHIERKGLDNNINTNILLHLLGFLSAEKNGDSHQFAYIKDDSTSIRHGIESQFRWHGFSLQKNITEEYQLSKQNKRKHHFMQSQSSYRNNFMMISSDDNVRLRLHWKSLESLEKLGRGVSTSVHHEGTSRFRGKIPLTTKPVHKNFVVTFLWTSRVMFWQ